MRRDRLHAVSASGDALEYCFGRGVCGAGVSGGIWTPGRAAAGGWRFAALTCFHGRNDYGFAARLWSYGYVCAGRASTPVILKAGVLALFLGASVFAVRRILAFVARMKFYREHVFVCKDQDRKLGTWTIRGFFWTTGNRSDVILSAGKVVAVASSLSLAKAEGAKA